MRSFWSAAPLDKTILSKQIHIQRLQHCILMQYYNPGLQRCSMMLFTIRDKTETTGTKQGHFFLCPVLSICVPVLSQHLSVMLLVDPVLSITVPVWSLDVLVWTMRSCFPSVQPGVRMMLSFLTSPVDFQPGGSGLGSHLPPCTPWPFFYFEILGLPPEAI